jgi:hypothetical protein
MTALTPGELRMEHAPHLSASGLGKRLSHPDCPWFARRCSEGGRLLEITPNPELLAWLTKPAQDGKRLVAERRRP